MNKLRLFSKEIEPSCSYCKYGFITYSGDSVLCEKRGVTMPKRPRELPQFAPSDFEL